MIEEAGDSWAGQFPTLLEISELTEELNALLFQLLSIKEEEVGFLGGVEPSYPSELVLQRKIIQGTGTIESYIMSHLRDRPSLLLLRASQTGLMVHVVAAL